MSADFLIETKQLCKSYRGGEIVALDNVTAGIKHGDLKK